MSRVFPRSVGKLNFLLQQLLLGQVFVFSRCRDRQLACGEEDFVDVSNEVIHLVEKLRLALSHFVPGAPQSVVGQKLHHVAGSKELIPDGQFPAIPWCWRLAHLMRSSSELKNW